MNGYNTAGPSHSSFGEVYIEPSSQSEYGNLNGISSKGGLTTDVESQRLEHDASIISHIYQSGFQQGVRTFLRPLRYLIIFEAQDAIAIPRKMVLNRSYRLHRLVLSRSPFLEMHIRSGHPQVYIPLQQYPYITEESFGIALGYLYGSNSLTLVTPINSRFVLATGTLLGGMDNLCNYSYELAKSTIGLETLDHWLEFLSNESSSTSSPGTLLDSPEEGQVNGGQYMKKTTGMPENPPRLPYPDQASLSHSMFGAYGPRLRNDIFRFLVLELPRISNHNDAPERSTDEPAGRDYDGLVKVYSRLPFNYFKAIIESPLLPIAPMQERFRFAKLVVAARKRSVARDAEESVVLAFGGIEEGGTAVHVTRRNLRRKLWKVGGK